MANKPYNWYEAQGVKPPESISHGMTDGQLEEEFAKLRAKTKHGRWIQSGTQLTCRNCDPPHSSSVPVDYLLTGTDGNGLPVLVKLGNR